MLLELLAFTEVIREDGPVVMIKGMSHCLDVVIEGVVLTIQLQGTHLGHTYI